MTERSSVFRHSDEASARLSPEDQRELLSLLHRFLFTENAKRKPVRKPDGKIISINSREKE